MKHKLLKVTIPACYTADCSRGGAVVEHFVCVFYMSETVIKLNSFFAGPHYSPPLLNLVRSCASRARARARVVRTSAAAAVL
jgi:hypothetical protein